MKIYGYVDYLLEGFILKGICRQYKEYQSFPRYYPLNQCIKSANCDGNNRIRVEEEKLKLIEKEIQDNLNYINVDILNN